MAPWLVILVVTFVFGTLMNLLAQYAEGGFKRMVERYKAQPLSVLAPYIGFAIPGVIVALFARFAGNGSQALDRVGFPPIEQDHQASSDHGCHDDNNQQRSHPGLLS